MYAYGSDVVLHVRSMRELATVEGSLKVTMHVGLGFEGSIQAAVDTDGVSLCPRPLGQVPILNIAVGKFGAKSQELLALL